MCIYIHIYLQRLHETNDMNNKNSNNINGDFEVFLYPEST